MHYTPGPWKVYEADCFPGYYGIDTRGKPSTSLVVFGKKSGIPKKEDARLIAAAPDLRAACVGGEKYPILWPIAWAELLAKEYRRVLEAAKELGYEDEDPEATSEMLITVEEFHRKLRAAIAQAEEPR